MVCLQCKPRFTSKADGPERPVPTRRKGDEDMAGRTSARASDAPPGEAVDTAPNRPGRKVRDTPVGVLATGPASSPAPCCSVG
ncbi:hypothetical protein GCM10023224_32050 [Streptomonospora halophila]|uniref:Uncharacterized protein n=1 Tax=Streptomonospora halophila TaxID=427369 RepID=A0ABP9GS39_9ACTN